MLNSRWGARILLLSLAALLAVGLLRLARFSSATSYPVYSSLRTGPLGTSVLFEALNRTGKVTAVRNYLPLDQLSLRNADLLYLGVSPGYFAAASELSLQRLEDIARAGNRVVVGISTGSIDFGKVSVGTSPIKPPTTTNRWDIRIRNTEADGKRAKYIIEAGAEWHAVAGAIALEREFGTGTVMVVPNANQFMNRTLARDNAARRIVALMVGARRTVIFDEFHLGVAETGSIAALARHYRLTGLMAGLLAVAALFVWKNSVRFPPPPPDELQSETVVVAHDAQSLLAGLLQRHVAAGNLITICVAEWNRMRPEKRIVDRTWAGQDPVLAYRSLAMQAGKSKKGRT